MTALGAALAGVALTLALGSWQLRRAAEKIALDEQWNAAASAPVLNLVHDADFAAAAATLPRHVRVRGTFELAATVWLDNRPLEGRAGFLVITPMRVQGLTRWVLINRGWAPRDPAERTRLPAIGRPDGVIEIEGIAVPNVPRVFQLGAPGAGAIRQNLDVGAMRVEMHAPLADFVVRQTSSIDDSLDRRWIAPSTGVDRHRAYAFQWFSLAALLGLVVLGLGWHAVRGRSAAGDAA